MFTWFKDQDKKGKGDMLQAKPGGIMGLIGHVVKFLLGLAALWYALTADTTLTGTLKIVGKWLIMGPIKAAAFIGQGVLKLLTLLAKAILPKTITTFVDDVVKAFKGFFKTLFKPVADVLLSGITKLFGPRMAGFGAMLFTKIGATGLRMIPIIGSLIDFGFAYYRFKRGDFIGGVIDLAAGLIGLIGMFPPALPFTTAISFGLNVLNAIWDLAGGGISGRAKYQKEHMPWTQELGPKLLKAVLMAPGLGLIIGISTGLYKLFKGDYAGAADDLLFGLPVLGPLLDILTKGDFTGALLEGELVGNIDNTTGGLITRIFDIIIVQPLKTFKDYVVKEVPLAIKNLISRVTGIPGETIDRVSGLIWGSIKDFWNAAEETQVKIVAKVTGLPEETAQRIIRYVKDLGEKFVAAFKETAAKVDNFLGGLPSRLYAALAEDSPLPEMENSVVGAYKIAAKDIEKYSDGTSDRLYRSVSTQNEIILAKFGHEYSLAGKKIGTDLQKLPNSLHKIVIGNSKGFVNDLEADMDTSLAEAGTRVSEGIDKKIGKADWLSTFLGPFAPLFDPIRTIASHALTNVIDRLVDALRRSPLPVTVTNLPKVFKINELQVDLKPVSSPDDIASVVNIIITELRRIPLPVTVKRDKLAVSDITFKASINRSIVDITRLAGISISTLRGIFIFSKISADRLKTIISNLSSISGTLAGYNKQIHSAVDNMISLVGDNIREESKSRKRSGSKWDTIISLFRTNIRKEFISREQIGSAVNTVVSLFRRDVREKSISRKTLAFSMEQQAFDTRGTSKLVRRNIHKESAYREQIGSAIDTVMSLLKRGSHEEGEFRDQSTFNMEQQIIESRKTSKNTGAIEEYWNQFKKKVGVKELNAAEIFEVLDIFLQDHPIPVTIVSSDPLQVDISTNIIGQLSGFDKNGNLGKYCYIDGRSLSSNIRRHRTTS